MSDEKRRSRRCPVTEGQNAVTIRVGRESYRGDLINISAEGFAVVIPDMAVPKTDQLLELECRTGRHEVRVARWETEHGRIRLGLHRVRDILDARVADPMPPQKLLTTKSRLAPASVLLALGFCVLVLVVAAALKFGQEHVSAHDLLQSVDGRTSPQTSSP